MTDITVVQPDILFVDAQHVSRVSDPRSQAAYTLDGVSYRMTARLTGDQPAALPPFADLFLDPAAIWT